MGKQLSLLADVSGEIIVWVEAQNGDEFSDPHVKVKDGRATLRLHRIKLGSLSGRVVDAAGKPVAGVLLGLSLNGLSLPPDLREQAQTALEVKSGPQGLGYWGRLVPLRRSVSRILLWASE